jgi:ribosome-associated protein
METKRGASLEKAAPAPRYPVPDSVYVPPQKGFSLPDARKLQKTIVTALEDIKAHDIVSFDVVHLTSLFDRVIIASADSGRQLRALSKNVQDKVRESGARVYNVEGEDGDEWVLLDAGDVVVHIMQPSIRLHYNLEELWGVPKPKAEPKSTAAKAPRKTAAKKTAKKSTAGAAA